MILLDEGISSILNKACGEWLAYLPKLVEPGSGRYASWLLFGPGPRNSFVPREDMAWVNLPTSWAASRNRVPPMEPPPRSLEWVAQANATVVATWTRRVWARDLAQAIVPLVRREGREFFGIYLAYARDMDSSVVSDKEVKRRLYEALQKR